LPQSLKDKMSKPKHKVLPVVAPRRRYPKAWDIQNELFERRKQGQIPDVLMLTDHPPVYTLGKNAKQKKLR
jgi:lipoate-protein ligase B